jgi:hypothetical protein
MNTASAPEPDAELPELVPPDPLIAPEPLLVEPGFIAAPAPPVSEAQPPVAPPTLPEANPAVETPINVPPPVGIESKTQLQQQTVRLLHVQTNVTIELPQGLNVIHLGKPNDRIPPDVDVSGFPNSEIVSRIHADIRMEGDAYYLEDVGSSNGTYVNNVPLPMGNRHRLRPGDRISLGKGDKMSFLFQLS